MTPDTVCLRERVRKFSVHTACGRLHGPVPDLPIVWPGLPGQWQSCPCEAEPENWSGWDVAQALMLCVVCARGTAGGPTRWSWLGCLECRAVNDALGFRWGRRPLPLGRHSLMNSPHIAGRPTPRRATQQMRRLMRSWQELTAWGFDEFRQLATGLGTDVDVPLTHWQELNPPTREASVDAFRRLLDCSIDRNLR